MRSLLAAVGLLAALPLLAGCRAGGTSDEGTAARGTDLIGTTWTVEAPGVPDGTVARFTEGSIELRAGSSTTTLTWATRDDHLLVGRVGAGLGGAVASAWLTDATEVVPSGDGVDLVDAAHRTTATLVGTPTASAPAEVTPGPGVTDVRARDLVGTWALEEHPATAIRFAADGTWKAASACATSTPGGAGEYRVLDGGGLLVIRTLSLRLGCPVQQDALALRAPAITGVARAASFTIEDDVLTLYDRTGAEVGTLVRA